MSFAQSQSAPTAAASPPAPTSQPSTVVAPANVAAFFSADIYAKDSGYISEVLADIGDHVRKGQLLAVIDDPELLHQLASMEAMLAAKDEMAKAAEATVAQHLAAIEVARKQLVGLQAEQKLTQLSLKRQEALFAGKAVTDQQMDEMRAKADVTGAAVDVAQAKIAAAEADWHAAEANKSVSAAQVRVASADVKRIQALVEYTKVAAPFDGVITRRLVNPGDLVQAATASRTTPLFTCQKIDVVRVFCDVPEASAVGIRPGIEVDVKLFGLAGQTIHGTVTRIATSLDPATRTMRAEIDIPNSTEVLRPGMYAQVTLTPLAPSQVAEKTQTP